MSIVWRTNISWWLKILLVFFLVGFGQTLIQASVVVLLIDMALYFIFEWDLTFLMDKAKARKYYDKVV